MGHKYKIGVRVAYQGRQHRTLKGVSGFIKAYAGFDSIGEPRYICDFEHQEIGKNHRILERFIEPQEPPKISTEDID